MSDYAESVPALKDIYLEDSYVLAVHESPDELRFDLDAVLTETHPRWTKPQPDEQYAYLRISLVFARPRRVEWARKSGEDMPSQLVELAHSAQDLLTRVNSTEE